MTEIFSAVKAFLDLDETDNRGSFPIDGSHIQVAPHARHGEDPGKSMPPIEGLHGISFFKGLIVALPISALLWWAIINLANALIRML